MVEVRHYMATAVHLSPPLHPIIQDMRVQAMVQEVEVELMELTPQLRQAEEQAQLA